MKTLADVPEAMLVSSVLVEIAVAYVIWRLWNQWQRWRDDHYGKHDLSKRGEPSEAIRRRVAQERADEIAALTVAIEQAAMRQVAEWPTVDVDIPTQERRVVAAEATAA